MSTLADSLVSSSSRKLPIRKRPDLKARRQRYQGRIYWVVRDGLPAILTIQLGTGGNATAARTK